MSYLYVTDTRAGIHSWLGPPLIRSLWPDAEDAHKAGVDILKKLYGLGLHPRERWRPEDTKEHETVIFDTTLLNPLGISSGLDKHGEIPTQLLALGPAIVEIGGVTETQQDGNPQPRVFRVPSQQGMVNRYGLNSQGAERVAARLRHRLRKFAYDQGYGVGEDAESFVLNGSAGVPPGSLVKGKLLAVQVAKNSSTSEADTEKIRKEYARSTSLLAKYADIIVVNISCPNAPGFRELQQVESLTRILTGVVEAARSVDRKSKPAVMVKAGLDEDTDEQVATICSAVWASGVHGVVVGNTTTKRPENTGLSENEAAVMSEKGGYSGPQLFRRTVNLVKKYRRILDYPIHDHHQQQESQLQSQESPGTALPHTDDPSDARLGFPIATSTPKVIFCTGGITNGLRAMEVLNAGASVAQIYTVLMGYGTALVYGGIGTITSMKQEMQQEMQKISGPDSRKR
ncbi:Dihydroorotate dehydrogenase (quinone), mitochondrial [Lecanora helva]